MQTSDEKTGMGPQQERLMKRLFDDPNRKIRNFDIYPGTRQATAEEICEQINKAMDEVERGEATEIDPMMVD